MSVAIRTVPAETGVRLAVSGEIDVSNAPELRAAIDDAFAGGPAAVEVDIAEVPYIDSTGIGVLVGAAHRAAEEQGSFAVTHPQRNVARVLTLLGMGDELGLKD